MEIPIVMTGFLVDLLLYTYCTLVEMRLKAGVHSEDFPSAVSDKTKCHKFSFVWILQESVWNTDTWKQSAKFGLSFSPRVCASNTHCFSHSITGFCSEIRKHLLSYLRELCCMKPGASSSQSCSWYYLLKFLSQLWFLLNHPVEASLSPTEWNLHLLIHLGFVVRLILLSVWSSRYRHIFGCMYDVTDVYLSLWFCYRVWTNFWTCISDIAERVKNAERGQ